MGGALNGNGRAALNGNGRAKSTSDGLAAFAHGALAPDEEELGSSVLATDGRRGHATMLAAPQLGSRWRRLD